MIQKYNDYPFDEIAAAIEDCINRGATIYQKFSCEHCHERLIIDVPNTLYTHGHCDKCGHTTNIKDRGCNYLLTLPLTKEKKDGDHSDV